MAGDSGLKEQVVAVTSEISVNNHQLAISGLANLLLEVQCRAKNYVGEASLVLAAANIGGPVDIAKLNLEAKTNQTATGSNVTGHLEGQLKLHSNLGFINPEKARQILELLQASPELTIKLESKSGWQRLGIVSEGIHYLVNLGFVSAEIARNSGIPNPSDQIVIPVDLGRWVEITGSTSYSRVLAETASKSLGVIGKVVTAINTVYSSPKIVVWENINPDGTMTYNNQGKIYRSDGQTIGKII
jgi:hypothetical protein